MMKSTLIAILLLTLVKEAEAQTADTLVPFSFKPKQTLPDLHLDDWRKITGWPLPPKPGVTLYFDYTKFFEWLLPKKHPSIPRDCDPNFFLRDTIPPPPMINKDSIRKLQPPV